ncbi:Arc family DNA-binding protein [Sinorhizobium meliloti]|nr:Arc family DNA-binding protein [Sinorhizobium meliloti]RVO28332.1 Arc family DNA-binding protein [Sinorhizobium meliloti]
MEMAKAGRGADQFMVRLPEGMRDRIAKAAERSGRSMNAEIVAALETFYPPEPTLEDVLEKVHTAIAQSNKAWGMPYRQTLIDALDELSDTLTKGLEVDQRPLVTVPVKFDLPEFSERMRRWRRAKKYGVEQQDLEDEIKKGFLRKYHHDTIKFALEHFREGNPEKALRQLKLADIKFAEPEKAYRAIESDLRDYFTENWGSPEAPWDHDEEE